MANNLVVIYASRHGQSEKIARRIADIARVTNPDARVFDVLSAPPDVLRDCASLVVVGSVHFGRHSKALERFVRRNLPQLVDIRSAFVSVSLAAASPEGREEARLHAETFIKSTGWIPARVETFAGGLPYTKYGWFTRWLIRKISKAKGLGIDASRDYDYTDWSAVDAFARRFIAARPEFKIAG
jgi:menaquinone-dependent protoporphyrinogen oxidase